MAGNEEDRVTGSGGHPIDPHHTCSSPLGLRLLRGEVGQGPYGESQPVLVLRLCKRNKALPTLLDD